MKRLFLLGLIISAFLFLPLDRLYAQDEIKVEARVDSRVVAVDDIITFRVIISTNKEVQNFSVDFPQLKDFDSFGETNTRNFSQFNGRISASYGVVYSLGARRKGNLTIPAMTVSVDGKKFKTAPVAVKVVESALGDDIIIRFLPDKNRAFTGEQIELKTELLFTDQVRVSNYDFSQQPQFEGFIILDDTSMGRQPPVSKIQLNGRNYYAALLRKQVLFPLAPGKKSLDPLSVRVQYRRSGIGSPLKMSTIQTKKMEISVTPLPPGAPEGFLGAVGKYELEWSVDRSEGKANEPFTLKVELRGIGDIERAPDIKLDLPEDIEIINATSNSQAKLMQGFWAGTKNWEYIIIPKKKGTKTLGPASFYFFDPDKAEYQSVSTDQIILDVAAGDAPAAALLTTMPQADAVEGDIRYIKTSDAPLVSRESTSIFSWWLLALLAAVPLLNLAIYLRKIFSNIKPQDSKGLKKKNAITTAVRELENIRKMSEDQREKGLPRLKSTIINYFRDKLELEHRDVPFSEIRSALVRFDLHESPEIDRLIRILDMCQADKFAPIQDKKLSLAVMAKTVTMDLQEIDKKL